MYKRNNTTKWFAQKLRPTTKVCTTDDVDPTKIKKFLSVKVRIPTYKLLDNFGVITFQEINR